MYGDAHHHHHYHNDDEDVDDGEDIEDGIIMTMNDFANEMMAINMITVTMFIMQNSRTDKNTTNNYRVIDLKQLSYRIYDITLLIYSQTKDAP